MEIHGPQQIIFISQLFFEQTYISIMKINQETKKTKRDNLHAVASIA